MDFNAFIFCTVGRREDLQKGQAGLDEHLYQRMLAETAEIARAADSLGYAGIGHPEHHLQIEGFEMANDLPTTAMWLGQHTERVNIISCGWVATTHNPLRAAEQISTLDNMLKGRFGFGLVRGYQARWVSAFGVNPDLQAVGPWNKDTPADDINRRYFAEWVDVVLSALKEKTFSHEGEFWAFPPKDFVNPHPMPAYTDFGLGVEQDMRVTELGIAPRPYSKPHPTLYGGFSASMRTALFWARRKGRPIVMHPDLDFCSLLVKNYAEEAAKHGHDVAPGEEAAWGGLMVCAPTDAQAEEWAENGYWYWKNWAEQFGMPLPGLFIGSPETLKKKIDAAAKAFPLKEMFFVLPQGVADQGQVLASMELFSEKVMPEFS